MVVSRAPDYGLMPHLWGPTSRTYEEKMRPTPMHVGEKQAQLGLTSFIDATAGDGQPIYLTQLIIVVTHGHTGTLFSR